MSGAVYSKRILNKLCREAYQMGLHETWNSTFECWLKEVGNTKYKKVLE